MSQQKKLSQIYESLSSKSQLKEKPNNNNSNNNNANSSNSNLQPSLQTNMLSIPKSKSKRNVQQNLAKQLNQVVKDDTFAKTGNKSNDANNIPLLEEPINELTSFFSNGTLEEILTILHVALKDQNDVDIEFHPTDYRIRGRKFSNHIMAEFQIEIFQTEDNHPLYPSHIVVEFQRRSGDGIVFQQFLNQIMRHFNQARLVVYSQYNNNDNDNDNDNNNNNRNNNNNNRRSYDNSDSFLSAQPLIVPCSNDMIENDEKKADTSFQPSLNNNNNNGNNNNELNKATVELYWQMLFEGYYENKRLAAIFFAENSNNPTLIEFLLSMELNFVQRFGEILLKSLDCQVLRAIAVTLHNILSLQNDKIKQLACDCNLRLTLEKVQRRWSNTVEARLNDNNKIQVLSSRQIAEHMQSCIGILAK